MEKNSQSKPPQRRSHSKFTKEEKKRMVEAWVGSGESKTHHAQLAGVHPVTFHGWVKKYRTEASAPSVGFVRTTLIEGSEAIRLHLSGGAWVELQSVHVLAQLIRAIEETR